MKKSIFANAAIVALAMLASCQKEQFTENVAPVTGVTEFTATIEQPTKTVIAANGKVTWKAGDTITVKDADSKSAVYVAGSDGASTTFTLREGETAVGKGPYIATYGDIDKQVYDAAGANCPLTAAETSTTTFKFSSPYAVVKITAKSDGGEVIDSVGVSYGEKTYTLDCGEGVALTSEGIDFFVSVEPATDVALSATFHTDDKTATKERTSAVALAANDLLPVTLTFTEDDWKSSEEDTPGALKGVFTVSDGGTPSNPYDDVKVRFSRGNLRYVLATENWEFFEHQYDFCNTNTYQNHHSDTISLFTWGYGEWSTVPDTKAWLDNVSDGHNFPYANDWGSQVNDGNVWRTPSKDEWEFLLNADGTAGRSDANRFARAMVNGVKGLLIFPDDYDLPSGYSASEGGIGMSKVNKKNNAGVDDAPFPSSNIPSDKWTEMEDSGVVFLPAAGERYGSSIYNNYALYWSSTAIKTNDAYSIFFDDTILGRGHEMINPYGWSVRLVTDVSSAPAPTEPTSEYVEIAADYDNDPNTANTTLKWYRQNLAITDSGKKAWNGGNASAVKVPGTNGEEVIVGDYFQWAASYGGYNVTENRRLDFLLIYTAFTNKGCGESEDKFTFIGSKQFNQANAPYSSGSAYTKYNDSDKDQHSILDTLSSANDDVAHLILGENWRMPTSAEFEAMKNATYWAWDATDQGYYVFKPGQGTQGAVGGRADIADTDNKAAALLFFPAAGRGNGTDLYNAGDSGIYWSSSLYPDNTDLALRLSFSSCNVYPQSRYNRCDGFSVRPVSD